MGPTSHASRSESDPPAIVSTELTANDVLLGRGTGPNEHSIRFRGLTERVLEESRQPGSRYHNLPVREIAKAVVQTVKDSGGRFLSTTQYGTASC